MSLFSGKSLAFLVPLFHMLKQDEEDGRLVHAEQLPIGDIEKEDADEDKTLDRTNLSSDEGRRQETGKKWKPKHLRKSEVTGELLFRPRAVVVAPSRELVEQLGTILYFIKV